MNNAMPLIEPKEIEIADGYGKVRKFTISKFPAIAGREIVAKYPTSNLPKIGDYNVSQEVMFKLMSYVAVEITNGEHSIMQRLTSAALIDNHCGDFESLIKIEKAMMEYNCSFFRNGWISSFFEDFTRKAMPKVIAMLTDSLEQSLQTAKHRTTN